MSLSDSQILCRLVRFIFVNKENAKITPYIKRDFNKVIKYLEDRSDFRTKDLKSFKDDCRAHQYTTKDFKNTYMELLEIFNTHHAAHSVRSSSYDNINSWVANSFLVVLDIMNEYLRYPSGTTSILKKESEKKAPKRKSFAFNAVNHIQPFKKTSYPGTLNRTASYKVPSVAEILSRNN